MNSIDRWKNIDPNYAENKFEYLTKRIKESDALISEIQINSKKDLSLPTKLSLNSIKNHNQDLKREYNELMQHRVMEEVNIILDGDSFKNKTADVLTFSNVLITSQRLFTSIAQSLTKGPTERGRVGDALENLTRLRLVNTFPSSFGIKISANSNPDIFGESITISSLNTLYSVLNSLNDKSVLIEKIGNLSNRTISHLRSLLKILAKNEIETKIEWYSPSGSIKTWHKSDSQLNQLSVNIESIKIETTEDKSIKGKLLGASLLRNTFEIVSDEGLFTGRMTKESKELITDLFGKDVNATLIVNQVHDKLTNDTKEKYTLKGIYEA